ncbi:MAG TPA: PDZ domain-containing protein [Bacteroidales bacterium]|nr:PDZ domain-containing protein [Bacteroidales bacterium]
MKNLRTLSLLFSFMVLTPALSWGINTSDTRMLSQPAISADKIAFIYAEDLWVTNLDGTQPKRLTVDEGIESNPAFSPDGKWIAFSAEYDGNRDVFIVPAEGGIPARLTWHPGADIVRGFTPDGKNVLFISQRATYTNRYYQLFTVPVGGGFPTQLKIPNANYAAYSPDGQSMAYTPIPDRFQQWKNYRGGTVSTIWIISFGDYSIVKIPKPGEGCNDTNPMWIGDKIYFLSDRNGEFNLFSYDTGSKEIKQLTDFTDFPLLAAGSGNDNIIFEQAGYLHRFDPAASASKKLTVAVAADLQELRPRFVSGSKYIRSAAISPTGARAVFDFRGEIITVPAEKGDSRNITQTAGAHEKYPAWSPDGKYIAYFSDASGEYKLCMQPQDGKSEARSIALPGTGFYAYPKWSPDSKKITFADNGRNLYLLDVTSGSIKKIDTDELYSPESIRDILNDWSSDSRWFVYTKMTKTYFRRIFLYSLDQNKSFAVTDGLSDASEPVFDPGGRYLYFFASTDAGPVNNWFDQSTADMRATRSIYLLTLQMDSISPFARESDEEKVKAESAEPVKAVEPSKKDKKALAEIKKAVAEMKIDLEGMQDRIVAFPVKNGNYTTLGSGKDGEVLYIAEPDGPDGQAMLHKYDLKKRKDSEVMELDGYILSADGKKMLYSKKDAWGIAPSGEKPEAGKGMLNIADIQVKIDPLVEWPQIFDEAWRINRDYFYDPGMHGADWNAMKAKYSVFLSDLACRSDLNRLIQWMCSELSVGHHRVGGGDQLNSPGTVKGGLLGADYELSNSRYRLKKIYGGLNWNPSLRSPLTEPGVNARNGEYILAVNGKDMKTDRNLYSFFENTAGKIVEITLGPNPDYTGSRVVKVVPIENEYSLRNRDWVEGNLKKVTEATNGQVAYVYVPNTAGEGHEYFKRYFFPQVDRKAIIIDERFNGGGLIADYYIDILRKPYQANWNMRYGIDLKTPSASIQGPKVMIIDETAGSGGDMLPWMFRKFEVGTLVGKRTWGGLVGMVGFPELMDGGGVTAPNLAIWTKDGFIVENVGVAPDVEVEQWPAEVIMGRDPQLEKAIEVALKELEKNPQVAPQRPAYPVRVRH